MSSPKRTPFDLAIKKRGRGKELARDTAPQQHLANLARIAAAEQAINGGKRPNDGAELHGGACGKCGFAIHVAPPYQPKEQPRGLGVNRFFFSDVNGRRAYGLWR